MKPVRSISHPVILNRFVKVKGHIMFVYELSHEQKNDQRWRTPSTNDELRKEYWLTRLWLSTHQSYNTKVCGCPISFIDFLMLTFPFD